MSGTIEITQEEYKMLLEDHIRLQRAERLLNRDKADKLYYVSNIADMLDIELEEK